MNARLPRRRVLGWAAASAGLLAATASGLAPEAVAATRVPRVARRLRLLILGGPRFLGLHMAEHALARGHAVTFFNRGRTNADRLPEVERIRGDRNGDLAALAGRDWDAVLDNSGYVPRQVRAAAAVLAPRVRRYLFVSSVSVYPDFAEPREEASAVGTLADETVETVDGATYGPLKALCEREARVAFGEARCTVLRPGLIVGPEDNTDRFTWWPERAARGGEFIAPGARSDGIQVVDARDLAAFAIRLVEREVGGTFNVISPPGRFSMGQLVDESVAAARALARPAVLPQPVWIPAPFLAEQGVQPWSEMPVWLPAEGESAAFARTSVNRALAAGLAIRPLRDTVLDTLRWQLGRPAEARAKPRAGIDPAKEQQVLEQWRRHGALMG